MKEIKRLLSDQPTHNFSNQVTFSWKELNINTKHKEFINRNTPTCGWYRLPEDRNLCAAALKQPDVPLGIK